MNNDVSCAAQQELTEFMEQGYGLAILIGRKGVGKTHALHTSSNSKCFYFCSQDKENAQAMKTRLANEWGQFSGDKQLSFRASHYLSWFDILQEFETWAQEKELCLVFDDAHWLTGPRTGFLDEFVNFWKSWKENRNIKIVLATSSSRFLDRQIMSEGGDFSKYLRIDMKPLQMRQVSQRFFPNWSAREVGLAYLMTGGIPSYLKKMNSKETFVAAVQDMFFSENWIEDEVQKILTLHFSKRGVASVLKILKTMPPEGVLQSKITEYSKVPQSSVSEILTRLVDFGLIYRRLPYSKEARRNDVGYLYFLNDRFLCFWFQVLEEHFSGNEQSRDSFANMLLSESGTLHDYYEKALELLVQEVFEGRVEASPEFYRATNSEKVMGLSDQISSVRPVESHWGDVEDFKWSTRTKESPAGKTLVLSKPWTPSFALKAKDEGVHLVSFEQLIGEVSEHYQA
ncbi:MAG: ATP-binding protein [Oligoflexales bacterium]